MAYKQTEVVSKLCVGGKPSEATKFQSVKTDQSSRDSAVGVGMRGQIGDLGLFFIFYCIYRLLLNVLIGTDYLHLRTRPQIELNVYAGVPLHGQILFTEKNVSTGKQTDKNRL